ncbi:M48 family metallopeptidase [Nitrosomonas eutropha]|uniref:STE24 endopeptidase n=2 Tax=Nitrosomonas eutropha TaxID=916 RepID=A0ABX5M590_9PROT|nr:M48 family metallopeptidase [Nitrosomonas eutropha]ABI60506.1 Ste24 endopeptidase [Nitrosomonas eutropha C91]PXV79375.1 STE24 endopeptidase [Nitrosomonas eutropha]SEJ11259.1 STE24 endopeptidase [Nitrosomonas eutropha]
MHIFTIVFILALTLTTLVQLWLATRHIRHITANRDQVPAAFASQIELSAHQKAADYTCAKVRLSYPGILLNTGLLLVLTLGGGLELLSDFWYSWFSDPLWHGMVLIFSVLALLSIVAIPFNYYRTFVIEQQYGFNKMTRAMFFTDLVKQTVVVALLGAPLLLSVLWLMEKTGDNWWLYTWLTWIGFNLFLLAVYPNWIAPLFNKFSPLENDLLKARIENLLRKCGFESSGLFVMDGSRRSSHGNAYFTGFGKTKRIVFFDTLLNRLEAAEIEAVLAHELGHFKRHHVIKRIALSFVVSLLFLWVLGYLMQQPWFYNGLGVQVADVPSTAMALLLFFLVMPVFTFLLQPLSSIYSRKHEFEADEYAAQQSSAADMIQALVKMYQDNAATLTPDPLHSAFYDSHPPAAIRVAHLKKIITTGAAA